jgi:hypothetical protein
LPVEEIAGYLAIRAVRDHAGGHFSESCEHQPKRPRSVRPGSVAFTPNESEDAMPTKWNDPQLDRAQFATDKLFERYQAIAVRIAELGETIRAGKASAAEVRELVELKDEQP